jgi:hypothetical protein
MRLTLRVRQNAIGSHSRARCARRVGGSFAISLLRAGVTIDDILADAGLAVPTDFVLAHCFDGYSTNVPLADLTAGKAMVALSYEGEARPAITAAPRACSWSTSTFGSPRSGSAASSLPTETKPASGSCVVTTFTGSPARAAAHH